MGESNHQDLTEHSQQWYDLLPDRLKEEVRLMKEVHPSFKLHHKPGENVYWTGVAKVFRKSDGSELAVLKIKVECPASYPRIFPLVHDVDKKLVKRSCPHLTKIGESHTICYGNRLDAQLKFEEDTRVKDVVNYVCIFLARQWHFERYGSWPDGQLHGALTFLEYELKEQLLDPNAQCPCGLTMREYRYCHMVPALATLDLWDKILTKGVRNRIDGANGRNDPCPCGSGRKFKKCHLSSINFPNKIFLFLKYPEAFGYRINQRDRLLNQLLKIEKI